MKKSKVNRAGSTKKVNVFDQCQTPHYALDPLTPYLSKGSLIWESAAGDGNIVRKLQKDGFTVVSSDLLNNQNFFDYSPSEWSIQVTNPPYSTKYEWVKRSYELAKPFALLLPFDTWAAAKANTLFDKHGIEVIVLNPRVNFKMPNAGYGGKGAHFSTAWFCWGLNIGAAVTYAKITRYDDTQTIMDLTSSATAASQESRLVQRELL